MRALGLVFVLTASERAVLTQLTATVVLQISMVR
jgi:hypothetical protein